MKIYSYRPPRIRPIELDSRAKKHNPFFYILPVLSVVLLAGYFLYPRHQEMISAVISDGVNAPPEQITQETKNSLLLTQMKPFLRKASDTWKLRHTDAQQAIGGGPGLIKDALDVKAAISVNYETGEVYYASHSQERMRFASITKIMTAMTAIDLVNMDESFVVEQAATEVEPTVIGVHAGEMLTARELIKAGLLTSGNDAMAVLAEGIGKKYDGDTSLFIAAMNEKATRIGMKNTRFANPQGYDDPNHYSTAEDIILMTRYALENYPQIVDMVGQREDHLAANETHGSFHLPNWNMLIGTYPGADGVKIGNTGEAGHTTVASATRDGKKILVVVLGADGILKRDLSAAELLNVGFAHLGISPFLMTEELLRTRIKDWY